MARESAIERAARRRAAVKGKTQKYRADLSTATGVLQELDKIVQSGNDEAKLKAIRQIVELRGLNVGDALENVRNLSEDEMIELIENVVVPAISILPGVEVIMTKETA